MIFDFENCRLDTGRFELSRGGEAVPLERQVFDVLSYLVENSDRLVPKEELLEKVWGDRFVSESALNSRVMAARRAIGDSGKEQRLIRTVHGRGYRFVGRVKPSETAAPRMAIDAGLGGEIGRQVVTRVSYCITEDGVGIAYSALGKGPPLVVCQYLFESFTYRTSYPGVKLIEGLSRGRRLILYDSRGTGMSDRNPGDVSVRARALDLEAVVAANDLGTFSLYAGGLSGPVAMTYSAENPDRVAALVLYSTVARLPVAVPRDNVDALALLARANWPVAAQTLVDITGRREAADQTAVAADVMRQSTTGEMAAEMILAVADADVRDLLPRIRARTLVLQRSEHPIYTLDEAREIAAKIPGARLIPLPGSVTYVGTGSDEVLEALESFLDEDPEARGS